MGRLPSKSAISSTRSSSRKPNYPGRHTISWTSRSTCFGTGVSFHLSLIFCGSGDNSAGRPMAGGFCSNREFARSMAASTNGSGPCGFPLRLFPPRRVLPWREPFPPFLLDFGDVESLFGFFLVLTVVFQQEEVHQSVVQISTCYALILEQ